MPSDTATARTGVNNRYLKICVSENCANADRMRILHLDLDVDTKVVSAEEDMSQSINSIFCMKFYIYSRKEIKAWSLDVLT